MKKRLDSGKTFITIIVLNLAELAIIAAILLYPGSSGGGIDLISSPGMILLLFAIVVIMVLNSLAALKNRTGMLQAGKQFQLVQDTLSKLEEFNRTLRAQRHDFMNHLQVVYSLIEMDEYKDSKDYIEKIYNDIQKVSRVMKTSNPAVNALLQAKINACEKKGIKVELIVTTQLKDFKLPAWEFCRVLGNILDNSIYALEEKGTEMSLRIEMYEDLKYFYFRVNDNGTPIPSGLLDKIFEPGFTTKGNKGEGMGLAISREIMDQYGGSLEVSAAGDSTVFEGRIPK